LLKRGLGRFEFKFSAVAKILNPPQSPFTKGGGVSQTLLFFRVFLQLPSLAKRGWGEICSCIFNKSLFAKGGDKKINYPYAAKLS
jgi:hypothetical protein